MNRFWLRVNIPGFTLKFLFPQIFHHDFSLKPSMWNARILFWLVSHSLGAKKLAYRKCASSYLALNAKLGLIFALACYIISIKLANHIPSAFQRRAFRARQLSSTSSVRSAPAFRPTPAPPRLPKEEQEVYERLQRASTGAFSTPRQSQSHAQDKSSPDQIRTRELRNQLRVPRSWTV